MHLSCSQKTGFRRRFLRRECTPHSWVRATCSRTPCRSSRCLARTDSPLRIGKSSRTMLTIASILIEQTHLVAQRAVAAAAAVRSLGRTAVRVGEHTPPAATTPHSCPPRRAGARSPPSPSPCTRRSGPSRGAVRDACKGSALGVRRACSIHRTWPGRTYSGHSHPCACCTPHRGCCDACLWRPAGGAATTRFFTGRDTLRDEGVLYVYVRHLPGA